MTSPKWSSHITENIVSSLFGLTETFNISTKKHNYESNLFSAEMDWFSISIWKIGDVHNDTQYWGSYIINDNAAAAFANCVINNHDYEDHN